MLAVNVERTPPQKIMANEKLSEILDAEILPQQEDLKILTGDIAFDKVNQTLGNPQDDASTKLAETLGLQKLKVDEGNNDHEEDEEKDENALDGSGKNKRKKKKKKAKSTFRKLPSQDLLERNFPVRITYDKSRGRYLVASRPFNSGDIVVVEKAVAFAVRDKFIHRNCHGCNKILEPGTLGFTCTKCGQATYCKFCSEGYATEHPKFCEILAEIPRIYKETGADPTLLRIVFQLGVMTTARNMRVKDEAPGISKGEAITRLESYLGNLLGEAGEVDVMNSSPFYIASDIEDVLSLESHISSQPAPWLSTVQKACSVLRETVARLGGKSGGNKGKEEEKEDPAFVSTDTLVELCCLVNTNVHGMGFREQKLRGNNEDSSIGMFPFVSLLNHSCSPNCIFFTTEDRMYVRLIRNVSQGEELTLSYVNCYESRPQRRLSLKNTKFFLCNCERCSCPLENSIDRFVQGVFCNSKGCKGVLVEMQSDQSEPSNFISLGTWKCDTCQRLVSPVTRDSKKTKQENGKKEGDIKESEIESEESQNGEMGQKKREKKGKVGPKKGAKEEEKSSISDRPWEVIARAHLQFEKGLLLYQNKLYQEAKVQLDKLLEENKKLLHPLNVVIFDAQTPLVNICRRLGDISGAIEHCETAIQAFREVLPWQIMEISDYYYNLGELYSDKARGVGQGSVKFAKKLKEKAAECFKQAEEIQKLGNIQAKKVV